MIGLIIGLQSNHWKHVEGGGRGGVGIVLGEGDATVYQVYEVNSLHLRRVECLESSHLL